MAWEGIGKLPVLSSKKKKKKKKKIFIPFILKNYSCQLAIYHKCYLNKEITIESCINDLQILYYFQNCLK